MKEYIHRFNSKVRKFLLKDELLIIQIEELFGRKSEITIDLKNISQIYDKIWGRSDYFESALYSIIGSLVCFIGQFIIFDIKNFTITHTILSVCFIIWLVFSIFWMLYLLKLTLFYQFKNTNNSVVFDIGVDEKQKDNFILFTDELISTIKKLSVDKHKIDNES